MKLKNLKKMEREKTIEDFLIKYPIKYLNRLDKLDANELIWFKENMKGCGVKAIHIDQFQIILKGKYNKVIKTIKNK